MTKKPKPIIDIEMLCGCKYQHYKNNSSHKFWTRCPDAEQLLTTFFQTWSIDDRNNYFEHYENTKRAGNSLP